MIVNVNHIRSNGYSNYADRKILSLCERFQVTAEVDTGPLSASSFILSRAAIDAERAGCAA